MRRFEVEPEINGVESWENTNEVEVEERYRELSRREALVLGGGLVAGLGVLYGVGMRVTLDIVRAAGPDGVFK